MNAEQLKAAQAPLKDRYKSDPATARFILRADATLAEEAIACRVPTPAGPVDAGLHPAAGGDGSWACSGDMLLQSLVACAGVTLKAVATALQIPLRAATVAAEGELDFRGTLGVSKETPIGFSRIRLRFTLDSDATAEQRATLLKLTERYCVILQTLKHAPEIEATMT
jgi:uncharacterized OsmC-like protein